jgi:hypothetical protein
MEQMIALNVGVLTRLTYAGLIATRCNVDDCPFSASYKRWRRCSSHGAYSMPRTSWKMRGCFSMGEPRGGVDCRSGHEGHLFIPSLTIAKIRHANVGFNRAGLRRRIQHPDVATHPGWLTLEQF